MGELKQLKEDAKEFKILYVEDNKALRKNAGKLLEKFFAHVDLAEDGRVALNLFKQEYHSIVITDIKMPNMDGNTLIGHIKNLRPDTKIIIMSAFDDKEFLYQGIEYGIFRFLKKPVSVTELSDVLHKAVTEIKNEKNEKLFFSYMKSIFNYQSSMVAMINTQDILLANSLFLDFFRCEDVSECKISLVDLSQRFLEHEGFLYNDNLNALEILRLNKQKLFHVKLEDQDKEIKHFIVKYQEISEKEDYGVLSFDDISELNLLEMFKHGYNYNNDIIENNEVILDLLQVVKRNEAKVEVHNYYNGLSITNSALVVGIRKDYLAIKTTYIQQKAIQIEKKALLVSNAFPYAIECSCIKQINFEKQEVIFEKLHFVKTSPITRSTIRVVPKKHTVSLFIGKNKFHGEMSIEDISLDALKLKLSALPAGLDEESAVVLDIVLELDKRPLIINTKAKMYRKKEAKHDFYVVFLFQDLVKKNLVKYITKRQMELIREIKGIQNG